MKNLFLVLLISLLALPCLAQRQDIRRGPFLTSVLINPGMTDDVITNAVGQAAPYTLIEFQPNPAGYYLIRTNFINWSRPQVGYCIPRGTTLVFGLQTDPVFRGAVWNDTEGARTNWIFGGGSIMMSNNNTVITQELANSYMYIELDSIRATTFSGEPIVCLKGDGSWHLEWTGEIGGTGYDSLIIGPSTLGWTRLKGHYLYASASGGQAIEGAASGAGNPLRNIWQVDYIFPDSNATGELLTFPDGITLRDTHIDLRTNSSAVQYTGAKDTIWENVKVTGTTNILYDLNAGNGSWVLRNCVISNIGTVAPFVLEASGESVTMHNCAVYSGGNTSILASAALGIKISGTLDTDKAPNTLASFNGITTGQPTTNNYGGAGTNVFINLGGSSQQVLVATNTTLLVWTNTAGLTSGKEVTVSVYNNQATNVTMVHIAAIRLLGFTNVLNNALTNMIPAGKEFVYKAKKVGTNISVFGYPQLN